MTTRVPGGNVDLFSLNGFCQIRLKLSILTTQCPVGNLLQPQSSLELWVEIGTETAALYLLRQIGSIIRVIYEVMR